MRIFLSGTHSEPDPSPGVGIGRSLREAFREAQLVAVDYSLRSSGIHHDVFDRVYEQWQQEREAREDAEDAEALPLPEGPQLQPAPSPDESSTESDLLPPLGTSESEERRAPAPPVPPADPDGAASPQKTLPKKGTTSLAEYLKLR